MMTKSIYCLGNKVGQEMDMKVCEKCDDKVPAKRINIVEEGARQDV